jgi:hypothetical protein
MVRYMTLRSAYDDLYQRTIERIPGAWAKLKYVAALRSSSGSYMHWGLERVHGPVASQDAFAKVHKTVLQNILRTRLNALQEDWEQCGEADRANLLSSGPVPNLNLSQVLPSGCPKETELHLLSVLETLSILESRLRVPAQTS